MQPDPFFAAEDYGSPPDDFAPPAEMPHDSPEWPAFERAAELIKRKSALTRELADIKEEISRLQPLIDGYFVQRGLPNITINGTTLYIRRQLWARAKAGMMPEICAAMRATGYGHFVHDTFNSSNFSAHVRELERQNFTRIASGEIHDVSAVLPPELAALLNIQTDIDLMGTPARKKHEA